MNFDEFRANTRNREDALYYADVYIGDISGSGRDIGISFTYINGKLDKLVDIHDRECFSREEKDAIKSYIERYVGNVLENTKAWCDSIEKKLSEID